MNMSLVDRRSGRSYRAMKALPVGGVYFVRGRVDSFLLMTASMGRPDIKVASLSDDLTPLRGLTTFEIDHYWWESAPADVCARARLEYDLQLSRRKAA